MPGGDIKRKGELPPGIGMEDEKVKSARFRGFLWRSSYLSSMSPVGPCGRKHKEEKRIGVRTVVPTGSDRIGYTA